MTGFRVILVAFAKFDVIFITKIDQFSGIHHCSIYVDYSLDESKVVIDSIVCIYYVSV